MSSDHHIDIATKTEILFFEVTLLIISTLIFMIAFFYSKIPANIKRVFLNILLLCISACIVLLILEFSIRFLNPQITYQVAQQINPRVYAESNYLPWQLSPNSSDHFSDSTGEFNVNISINNAGLRDDELQHPFSKDEKIILVLGDSFTFGYGVENNETYSQILEKMLNSRNTAASEKARQYQHYQVLNAGYASGYSPDTYYLYLKQEGLNFSPNVVLIELFVGNDISDLSKNIWFPPNATFPDKISSHSYTVRDHQLRIGQEGTVMNNALSTYFKIHVLQNLHSYILFKKKMSTLALKEEKQYTQELSPGLNNNLMRVEALLEDIQNMSTEHHFQLIVILIPERVQTNNNEWEEYTQQMGGAILDRTRLQNELISFFKEKQISYLDLYPAFYNQQYNSSLYLSDGHWNRKGQQFTAEQIYSFLADKELDALALLR